MAIFPVTNNMLQKSRAASGQLNGCIANIQAMARILNRDTRIQLTIQGRPLDKFGSASEIMKILSEKNSTLQTLESNVRLFFTALDQYHEAYKAVFNRQSVAFLGMPLIEVPLTRTAAGVSGSEKVIKDWKREILISNIFVGAEQLRDDHETFVFFRGNSLLKERDLRLEGQTVSWDEFTVSQLFIAVMFLGKALEAGIIPRSPKIEFEAIREKIFSFAMEQCSDVQTISSF